MLYEIEGGRILISAGVDEVGRGPLAGPVIAAAVILPVKFHVQDITDSKKLSPKKRLLLAGVIRERALCWSLGRAEVEEIDRVNIFNATLLAMRRAVESLSIMPDISLIDGKWAPDLSCATKTIIKGDEIEPSISAASIIAKVERDKEMCDLHSTYPNYGFDCNKGYATAQHLDALDTFGVCDVHRRSFDPVRRALGVQTCLHIGPLNE